MAKHRAYNLLKPFRDLHTIWLGFRGVLVLGGKDRNSFSIWKQHKRSKNTMGCYRDNIAWVTAMADITAAFSAVPMLKIITSTD